MNPYALLGDVVGGCIAIYLLSRLIEWAVMQRVLDDETVGRMSAVAAATVLALVIYGFASSHDGAWEPMPGGIGYLIAGPIVGVARYHALRRAQEADE